MPVSKHEDLLCGRRAEIGVKERNKQSTHDRGSQAVYRIELSFLAFLFHSFFSFIDNRAHVLGKVGRMKEPLSWCLELGSPKLACLVCMSEHPLQGKVIHDITGQFTKTKLLS